MDSSLEVVYQPLIIYKTETTGKFNVTRPGRVVDQKDAQWTVELVDFKWAIFPFDDSESLLPSNANSNEQERIWAERLGNVSRGIGHSLIITAPRDSTAYHLITQNGPYTKTNNVITTAGDGQADVMGYVTPSAMGHNDRLGGCLALHNFVSAGPALVQKTDGSYHYSQENDFMLRVCKGMLTTYPTTTEVGFSINQGSFGSKISYAYVDFLSPPLALNCSPLFLLLRYTRHTPLSLRYLL